MAEFLTTQEAQDLVARRIECEGGVVLTQEILNSGRIPRLKGYVARPGKVSDNIFGGEGSFTIDKGREGMYKELLGGLPYSMTDLTENGKPKVRVDFENPPLFAGGEIPLRLMVRSERISTHDLNRGSIPLKDQILALNHDYMRLMLREILGESQFEVDGLGGNSIVIAAEDLTQIPFETVLRRYMAKSSTSTSLYHHYVVQGRREFCGHLLPEGLIPNGELPFLMDTPSTKSDQHDESVAPQVLYERGICTKLEYQAICFRAKTAFRRVEDFARGRGLILADTKTEHGKNRNGKITVQDELYTLDSSRFWLRKDYERQVRELKAGEIKELDPKSYSKEFARGFSKGEHGYDDEQRAAIAVRYIEAIQYLLEQRFEPDLRTWEERAVSGLEIAVDGLGVSRN